MALLRGVALVKLLQDALRQDTMAAILFACPQCFLATKSFPVRIHEALCTHEKSDPWMEYSVRITALWSETLTAELTGQ